MTYGEACYICLFFGLPTVITEPGQYRTRCGEVVTVSVVSKKHLFTCHGEYSCGTKESWHHSGRIFPKLDTTNDIVAKV